MDGDGSRELLQPVKFESGELLVIGIEDLIADRMGQAFRDLNPKKVDLYMLEQAQSLFSNGRDAFNIEIDLLDRKIRQQTAGQVGIAELQKSRTPD